MMPAAMPAVAVSASCAAAANAAAVLAQIADIILLQSDISNNCCSGGVFQVTNSGGKLICNLRNLRQIIPNQILSNTIAVAAARTFLTAAVVSVA